MATVGELKKMIVNLKVDLALARVPDGHCPYAYYGSIVKAHNDCNSIGCERCTMIFVSDLRKLIEEEVKAL